MLRQFEEFLMNMAFNDVKDFLDYIGYDGEVMRGFINSLGQEIPECIQVTDDEGYGLFLIHMFDLDKGTYMGVMCENHKAPGTHEDFRNKYAKSDLTPVGVCRWALGI